MSNARQQCAKSRLKDNSSSVLDVMTILILNSVNIKLAMFCLFLLQPNYTAVAETCNTFRVYGDIMDAFQSIGSITGWYMTNPGHFLEVVKPGSFTDADMVS